MTAAARSRGGAWDTAHRRPAAPARARLRHAAGSDTIDAEVADRALSRLEIDALGSTRWTALLTMIADLTAAARSG